MRSAPLHLVCALMVACSSDGAPSTVPPDKGEPPTFEDPPEAGPPCKATAVKVATVTTLERGRVAPAGSLFGPNVFLAGGGDPAGSVTDTTVFVDPIAAATTASGKLGTARSRPAWAALSSGKLLVVGGLDASMTAVSSAETFDGNAFRPAGQMSVGRVGHTVTVLQSGQVLVAGGAAGAVFHDTAEIHDPASNAFIKSLSISMPRALHVAAPTADGALLIGGATGPGVETDTIDKLAGGVFTEMHSKLARPMRSASAVTLAGLVKGTLVTGGVSSVDGTLADAYIIQANSVRKVRSMVTGRSGHTLTQLPDGRVVAVGGFSDTASTGSVEIYDPSLDVWVTLPVALSVPRHDHIAVFHPTTCSIIVVGGQSTLPNAAPAAPREVEMITVPPKR